LDYPLHHPGRRSANLRSRHEWATEQIDGQPLAGLGRLVRPHYVFFTSVFLILPHPLPTTHDLAAMPWWAVIGGLVGAVQVYAGLTLVNRVGAGMFVGLTVTAALITSLVVDHFGWFRMQMHPISIWRVLGGLLMVAGVTLISRF
jgi:transporter family-2 protein